MGQVTVAVNGRSYTLMCDDGEEAHLTNLASYVDHQVQSLAASMGQVGDAKLILMASLLVADHMTDAVERANAAERKVEALEAERDAEPHAPPPEAAPASVDPRLADAFDGIAQRLESIAARLEAP